MAAKAIIQEINPARTIPTNKSAERLAQKFGQKLTQKFSSIIVSPSHIAEFVYDPNGTQKLSVKQKKS